MYIDELATTLANRLDGDALRQIQVHASASVACLETVAYRDDFQASDAGEETFARYQDKRDAFFMLAASIERVLKLQD